MVTNRLRALAQQIRIQSQQHPVAQAVLADRLTAAAEEAPAPVADRLRETAAGVLALSKARPWDPMTQAEREQLADFLELAAGSVERVAVRQAAGGAA